MSIFTTKLDVVKFSRQHIIMERFMRRPHEGTSYLRGVYGG
jgi:hypothetical protein